MKKSLKAKLILSFLLVALITVVIASVLIRLTSGQSLMSMVVEQQTADLEQYAQTYYTTNGSMDGFYDYYLQLFHHGSNNGQPDDPNKPPQGEKDDMRGILGMVDAENRALIPTFDYQIGDTLPEDFLKGASAIKVDGQTVAWILVDQKREFTLSPQEQLFLERTTLAIGLAALAGVIAAVAMGFLLAGRIIKPVRKLTEASKAMAKGELVQKVPVTSKDELGQLTETFNQMSADLVHADEQRKRLTADITHDLSTPLQVISGYIEMIDDGEVTLTPQRSEIIKTEIEHLRRLVGDLTTLSQVEAQALEIQLQPVSPSSLLERIEHTFQPIAARQGVELILKDSFTSPQILVDEGRIQQVLKNLIENALRYTSKGGKIVLNAHYTGKVELTVADDGAGIDAEDLPYVFDRFYQAEKARGSNSGKMGLGLAICKALVIAQGGIISAESAGKGQGTTIRIAFEPLP